MDNRGTMMDKMTIISTQPEPAMWLVLLRRHGVIGAVRKIVLLARTA
jgi:hypothetical protein